MTPPALTFECDSCGACCKTFPVFASEADALRVPRIREEARTLPEHLASPEYRYQLYPLPFHNSCCWLDENNLCMHYCNRPDVCREFKAGSEQCQEARRRHGIAELQPTLKN